MSFPLPLATILTKIFLKYASPVRTFLSKHGATQSSFFLVLQGHPCEHKPLSAVCARALRKDLVIGLSHHLLGQNGSVAHYLPRDPARDY